MPTAASGRPVLGDVPVPSELQTLTEPGVKYASDLWDALTPCTEPKGNEQAV